VASSAASRPLRRLGLAALIGGCAATLAACADRSPAILEVAFLYDTDDPAGPYRIMADVRAGDGDLSVRVFLTDQGIPALVAGVCAEGPPPLTVYEPAAGRLTDGGVVPPTPDAGSPDAGTPDAGTPDAGTPDAGTPQTDTEPADAAATPRPAEPAARCYAAPMRRSGGRWVLDLEGPPYPFGTRIDYYVEARDGDGDVARWPSAAPGQTESVRIGPPGRAPVVFQIVPRSGPATGGTEVLMRGEDLAPEMVVLFGGAPAERVEVGSPQQARVVAPAGTPGVVDLVVERRGLGSRLVGAFEYVGPPVVDAVLPSEGPTAGGGWAVIEGAGFRAGASVRFGDAEAPVVEFVGAGVLGVEVPAAQPSVVDVTVTNPDEQVGTARLAYRYWPPPVLETIEPPRGPDFGGNLVALTGADLRAPGVVLLDGVPARVVEVGEGGRTATFIPPPQAEGPAQVVFVNPDGQFAELDLPYVFLGPPVVDAVEPPVASRCGGGIVTLVGRNFDPEVRVFLGDAEAEVIEVSPEGTRAVVRAPAGDIGPVRVRVVNPDGRSTVAADAVVYGIQPVVESVVPGEAPVWGCVRATVVGGDIEAGATVTVGGAPARVVTPAGGGCEGELVIELPANPPGPAEIVVTNPDRIEGRLPDAVRYVAPTLSPDAGLTPGYTTVELSGPDLRAGLQVEIGGAAVRGLVETDDGRWRFVTPPGARGPADVAINNADGCGTVLESGFEYRVLVDETDARIDAPGDCNDVSVADIDADGDLDYVAANGALASGGGQLEQAPEVHLNDGSGRFERRALAPVGNGMNAKLGDLDGDGDLDLYVSNLSSATNHLFRNLGRGRFEVIAGHPATGPSYDGDWVDVEGDGDLDLFLIRTGGPENGNASGPEQLFLNDGAGRLTPASEGVYFSAGDVHDHDGAFGDLNGDGLPEVVITVDNISPDFRTAENRLLVNRGLVDGAPLFEYQPAPFNRLRGDWLHVELADLDGDGDLDVLMPQDYVDGISSPEQPALALYLNDGVGGFEEISDRAELPLVPAYDTETVDIDGDGDADILVGGFGSLFQGGFIEPADSWLLLNDGSTRFFDGSAAFQPRVARATTDFGAADFDGDGDIDLVECAEVGGSVMWIQTP
jgi:hypothetical protein